MVEEFAKILILNTFETVVGVELWRAINAQCVTRVSRVFFLIKFHGEHVPDLSLGSDSRLPYSVHALYSSR